MAVVFNNVAVAIGNLPLQALNVLVDEFDHLAGFNTNHVVVVLAGVELIIGVTAFEIVFDHQSCRYELAQYPINSGQADVLARHKQGTIDIIGGHVLVTPSFQQFQDTHSGLRDLQAYLAQVSGFDHLNSMAGFDLPLLAGFETLYIITPRSFCSITTSRTRMTKRLLITLCACLIVSTGCNILYKQNIQQGNALEQEDLDQLELGMSQNQVAFLLGTPAIRDPFHHERWDYVSTFSRRGGDPVMRQVNLRFENGELVEMRGVDPLDSGEKILTEEGAVAVTTEVAPVGVRVEDARDYEDLEFVPEDSDVWTLQLGSFSNRSQADGRLAKLLTSGISASVQAQVIGDVGFFVVRSEHFETREEALTRMAEIEEKTGLRPFLVSPGS